MIPHPRRHARATGTGRSDRFASAARSSLIVSRVQGSCDRAFRHEGSGHVQRSGSSGEPIHGAAVRCWVWCGDVTDWSRGEPEEMHLAQLLAMPGIREECRLGSSAGFMALHGGSQDGAPSRSPGGLPSKRAHTIGQRPAFRVAGPSHLTFEDPTTRLDFGASWRTSALPCQCMSSGATASPAGLIPTAASSLNHTGPRFERGPSRGSPGKAELPTARLDTRAVAPALCRLPVADEGNGSAFISTTLACHRPMVSRSKLPPGSGRKEFRIGGDNLEEVERCPLSCTLKANGTLSTLAKLEEPQSPAPSRTAWR
jgi:hypothetical protein